MTKVPILISLLILSLIACNSQSPKPTPKQNVVLPEKEASINQFWEWFKANEKDLRNFQQNPDKILTQVLDSARKIHAGLAIEFEPPKDGIITVTVSADGDKNLFPIVKQTVEQAPKIKAWNIVAFRQRMLLNKVKGMKLKVQENELSPDKMKFFPVITNDSLDIIIYTDNVTEENYNQIGYAGLLLIDNILGEYDCVTKVRHYDFQNMPTKQSELVDVKPLLSLTKYVDSFYAAKHN